MLKRLLVGVSGAPASAHKIDFTVEIAKRHGASITLLSVVDINRLSAVGPVPLGADYYAAEMAKNRIEESHAQADAVIEKFEAACRAAGVSSRSLRVEGDPIDVIIRQWRYHDLCLLGAKGWFDYDLVAEPHNALLKLIEHDVNPILTVADKINPCHQAVIAYNGSPQSAHAMKQFLGLKIWPDIEIHMVCVDRTKTGEPVDHVLEEAASYAQDQGYRSVHTIHLSTHGTTSETLMAYAKKISADVIVAGSSHRRIILGKAFGPNAMDLLRSSPYPVFLSH